MAGNTLMIWVGMEVEYFCARGWTDQITLQ
jgi:hypothetical protein